MEVDSVLSRGGKNQREIVQHYHKALCAITEKLSLRYRYDSLRKELFLLKQESIVSRSETATALAKSIMQNLLMQDLPEKHDFGTFIIYHTTRLLYYQLTGNFKQSFLEQQLIFEAFKNPPLGSNIKIGILCKLA